MCDGVIFKKTELKQKKKSKKQKKQKKLASASFCLFFFSLNEGINCFFHSLLPPL